MKPEDFCRWLRGYFEIAGETALTKEQATIISQHLALVFEEKAKTLPPVSVTKKKEMEEALRKIQQDAQVPLDPSDPRGQIICSRENPNDHIGPDYCQEILSDRALVDCADYGMLVIPTVSC